MKNFSLVICLSLYCLFTVVEPIMAQSAGPANGGGGIGVLCGNGDQLEILDLYEARMKGLRIPDATGNLSTEFYRYGLKFIEFVAQEPTSMHLGALRKTKDEVKNFFTTFEKKEEFYDSATGTLIKWEKNLPLTTDATLPSLAPGCRFVQIAINYRLSEKIQAAHLIKIDPYFWDKLDSLNKVALIFHELLYMRVKYGSELYVNEDKKINSDESREVIRRLLLGIDLPSIAGPIAFEKYKVFCGFGGGDTHGGNEEHFIGFAVNEWSWSHMKRGVGFYFNTVKDRTVNSRTYAFIPNLTLDMLASIKNPLETKLKPWHRTATIVNSLTNTTLEMQIGTGDNEKIFMRAYNPQKLSKDPTKLPSLPNFSAGFCQFE